MTAHVAQFLLEDEYFLQSLKAICKALKVGGSLLFDSRNPLMQAFFNPKIQNSWPDKNSPQKLIDPKFGKINWWVELQEIKNNRIIYENHYFFENSKEESISINELIFRQKEEVVAFLQKAGFEIENIYGNWDKSLASRESPEFIFVAEKL